MAVLLGGALTSTAAGAASTTDFDKEIKPILQTFCYDCHAGTKKKGGVKLDGYADVAALLKDHETWESVLRAVRSGEMPPDDEKQPTADERDKLLNWLEGELFKVDCENPDPGRVTIRRLNRTEYNNTIRDLVGVNFRPADDFPADDTGYGFDNIGDVLSMPPVLIEKYMRAAEKVLDEAIWTEPRHSGTTNRIEAEKMEVAAEGKVYNKLYRSLEREGQLFTHIKITEPGEYLIVTRAFGSRAGDELPKLELRLADAAVKVFDVEATESAPQVLTHKLTMKPGDYKLATAYINNFRDEKASNNNYRDRNLYVDYVEVIGPLRLMPYPESHKRIFAEQVKAGREDKAARKILESFSYRAFRRPVKADEIDRLMKLVKFGQEQGETFEGSVKLALQAVLVSPHFLFRGEIQPEPDNPALVHPINEFALASRLSYFLWSSMPDEELLRQAERKTLRKNLDNQVRRMLADPKSRALVDNFASQWLQFRRVQDMAPDFEKFPDFDEELRAAMLKETELFFEHIMREDRSVLDFLTADYTFVNQRLAAHYDLKGVQGNEFRKVSLKGTRRSGILTHASVLTITSNPTRTSPVKRGLYVLENLLHTPPPPAPPDVPELGEVKLVGSLRERMVQHRDNALCASCHARMDPIGFGLENFDAIGRWRNVDEKFPIDASGVLVSGEKFEGADQLNQVLSTSKREDFVRCITEKMLTYALGRGLEYYDKCAVDKVAEQLGKGDYKFSKLVTEIVRSVPFQQRRGEGERRIAQN
ncbi:MAG TPA: DUF1592 domain-containing protein [Methylomirabilota bacterium]|nr:DUF1592 domain-containing protein [Methylomirabilota bacterium]